MKKLQPFLAFLCILALFGCGDAKNYAITNAADLQPLHDLIQGNVAQTNNDSIEVYIDYSDGMHPAIQTCNEAFDRVLNLVDDTKTRYLICGHSDHLQPLTKTELNATNDPKLAQSFSEDLSILDKPLDRIVKIGKQAVYITDFELTRPKPIMQNVPNGQVLSSVDFSATWATSYFNDWLTAGNRIDVFAKPFAKQRAKGAQNQYLYFLIFTPNFVSDNRIVDDLAKFQQADTTMKHLTFSKTQFQATTEYGNSTQFGLNEMIGSHNHIQGNGFEYYQMEFKHFEALKSDNPLILNKLVMNHLAGFTNPTFEAKVEDVTQLYGTYVDSVASGMANEQLSKIKWAGIAAPHFFELDTKSDANGKTQFGIKKHIDFARVTGKNQLFKVSIVFKSVDYQPDIAQMEQILQWRDANSGHLVPGLYTGLKEAAGRFNLKNRPVYTYYIDVLP